MNQSHDVLSREKDRAFHNLKVLLEEQDLPQSANQLMLLRDILSYKIEAERRLQRRSRFSSTTSDQLGIVTAKG
jgi:hypothetical protein